MSSRKQSSSSSALFTCKHCGKTFTKQNLMRGHLLRMHREEKPFLCKLCGKRFLFKSQLNEHLQKHSQISVENFPCQFCCKIFRLEDHLYNHTKSIHSGLHPYLCHICNKTFSFKKNLEEHLRQRGSEEFRCTDCKGIFHENNLRVKMSQTKKLSSLCYKCWNKDELLLQTLEITPSCEDHKLNNISNLFTVGAISKNNEALRFIVNKFNGAMYKKVEVVNDVSVQCGPDAELEDLLYICDRCNKCFQASSELCEHQILHHTSFTCEFCNKVFTEAILLKDHIERECKPHHCEICGQTFGHLISLQCHLKEHEQLSHDTMPELVHYNSDPEPLHCRVCGLRFLTSALLESHQNSCMGESCRFCEICRKPFSEDCTLRCYLISNTDYRYFHCEQCGKKFSTSDSLRNHENTHKEETNIFEPLCALTMEDDDDETVIGSDGETNRLADFKDQTDQQSRPLNHGFCNVCKQPFDGNCSLKCYLLSSTRPDNIPDLLEPPKLLPVQKIEPPTVPKLIENIKTEVVEENENNSGMKHREKRKARLSMPEGGYACEPCDLKFKTFTDYKIHFRYHTGGKVFLCNTCGKEFLRPFDLNRHKKTHTPAKAEKSADT